MFGLIFGGPPTASAQAEEGAAGSPLPAGSREGKDAPGAPHHAGMLGRPSFRHGLRDGAVLFLAVGIAYWQYGGGLALMPAYTADFFGPKNLGMNYGLVFIGWGLGFFMTRLAGTIKDITGTLTWAFILSAIVLIIAVVISRVTKRPMHAASGEAR